MFGINCNDPQTLWLNVVNAGLGLVILICIAAIGYGVLQDVLARVRRKATVKGIDREVHDLVSGFGDHAFDIPGLGLTMADGGEPLPDKPAAKKPGTKARRTKSN
jgi:hypothetical protein